MDWTGHDATSRSALLTKLLSHVRVPFISQDFLHAKAIPFLRANEDCQDYVKKLVGYLELNEEEKLTNSLHCINPRDFESEVIVGLFTELSDAEEEEFFTTSLHVLDSEIGKWTRIIPTSNFYPSKLFCAIDGKMYFLRESHKNIFDKLFEFDLLTNTERLVTTLGTARRVSAIVGLNGKVYIIGGKDMNRSVSSVEVCNPEDNSCSYVACMSSKRRSPGVIAHKGRIYAFGGTNAESGRLSTAEVYIPEEDRWEDIPSMSVERVDPSVVELEGKIYVMGDVSFIEPVDYKIVDCYDPGRKMWKRVADLQCESDNDNIAAVNWKGELHVFHQVDHEDEEYEDTHVFLTFLQKYDPKENHWIKMTSPAISAFIRGIYVMKKKYLPKPIPK